VFQNYALYPHMTVFDNMSFGLKLRRTPKNEIEQRVRNAAEILNISELLDRQPKQLSGGQRQRVAMGRAIVRDPQVFLFDEPLSNLDAKLRVQMRTEIKELHQRLQTTSVYVTHDQIEAMTMADKIVVMDDGRIEQVGSPLELYNRPKNLFVAKFIGSPAMNLLDAQVAGDGGSVELPGGDRLALPADLGAPAAGRAVTLGVRPEHMDRDQGGTQRPGLERMRVTIDLVQPTGSRTYGAFKLGETEMVAELQVHDVEKPGEKLDLLFDMNRVVLIDPASDKVI